MKVDAAAIRALADILVATGLTEIELAEGESHIRVARAPAQVVQASVAAAPPPAPAAAITPEAAFEDFAQHPGAVKSPMVGVAYLSPEPGAPAFVGVGQSVNAGQTLLLIEAMKTFNQIKAPKSGTVARVMIGNGTPVEYGEVLMVVE